MKTPKRSLLGCVVVLLVAGVVSFPKTAFGLEVVVGCAGAPPVTGVAAVTVTTADGRQWSPIAATCNSNGSRRGSIEVLDVTSWSVDLTVTGNPGMSTNCGPFADVPLPARLTRKQDTEHVTLHVTVK